ncbi:MAG: hypothetical protein WDW38_005299 [Sanguina aurantia]
MVIPNTRHFTRTHCTTLDSPNRPFLIHPTTATKAAAPRPAASDPVAISDPCTAATANTAYTLTPNFNLKHPDRALTELGGWREEGFNGEFAWDGDDEYREGGQDSMYGLLNTSELAYLEELKGAFAGLDTTDADMGLFKDRMRQAGMDPSVLEQVDMGQDVFKGRSDDPGGSDGEAESRDGVADTGGRGDSHARADSSGGSSGGSGAGPARVKASARPSAAQPANPRTAGGASKPGGSNDIGADGSARDAATINAEGGDAKADAGVVPSHTPNLRGLGGFSEAWFGGHAGMTELFQEWDDTHSSTWRRAGIGPRQEGGSTPRAAGMEGGGGAGYVGSDSSGSASGSSGSSTGSSGGSSAGPRSSSPHPLHPLLDCVDVGEMCEVMEAEAGSIGRMSAVQAAEVLLHLEQMMLQPHGHLRPQRRVAAALHSSTPHTPQPMHPSASHADVLSGQPQRLQRRPDASYEGGLEQQQQQQQGQGQQGHDQRRTDAGADRQHLTLAQVASLLANIIWLELPRGPVNLLRVLVDRLSGVSPHSLSLPTLTALLWSLSLLASYTIKALVVQPDLGASLQPQPDAGDANTGEKPHAGAVHTWVPVLPGEPQHQILDLTATLCLDPGSGFLRSASSHSLMSLVWHMSCLHSAGTQLLGAVVAVCRDRMQREQSDPLLPLLLAVVVYGCGCAGLRDEAFFLACIRSCGEAWPDAGTADVAFLALALEGLGRQGLYPVPHLLRAFVAMGHDPGDALADALWGVVKVDTHLLPDRELASVCWVNPGNILLRVAMNVSSVLMTSPQYNTSSASQPAAVSEADLTRLLRSYTDPGAPIDEESRCTVLAAVQAHLTTSPPSRARVVSFRPSSPKLRSHRYTLRPGRHAHAHQHDQASCDEPLTLPPRHLDPGDTQAATAHTAHPTGAARQLRPPLRHDMPPGLASALRASPCRPKTRSRGGLRSHAQRQVCKPPAGAALPASAPQKLRAPAGTGGARSISTPLSRMGVSSLAGIMHAYAAAAPYFDCSRLVQHMPPALLEPYLAHALPAEALVAALFAAAMPRPPPSSLPHDGGMLRSGWEAAAGAGRETQSSRRPSGPATLSHVGEATLLDFLWAAAELEVDRESSGDAAAAAVLVLSPLVEECDARAGRTPPADIPPATAAQLLWRFAQLNYAPSRASLTALCRSLATAAPSALSAQQLAAAVQSLSIITSLAGTPSISSPSAAAPETAAAGSAAAGTAEAVAAVRAAAAAAAAASQTHEIAGALQALAAGMSLVVDRMAPCDVAAAVRGFAALQHDPGILLKLLADRVRGQAGECPPQAMADVVMGFAGFWAAGRLRSPPLKTVAALAQSAGGRLVEFDARALSELCWGCASMGWTPGPAFLAAVEEKALVLGFSPAATRQQLGTVAVSRRSLTVRATGVPPVTPPPGPPAAPVPPPVVPAYVAPPPKAISIGDAMAFTGVAPETINGRLAMLGFVAAIGAEFTSHATVVSQARPLDGFRELSRWHTWCLFVKIDSALVPIIGGALLFIGASFVPILNGGNLKRESGPFTPAVELFNGRAAMIGFLALIVLEQVSGKSLI